MTINCPKCGFSQPQDRYCANCGVDMELFKPSRRPWYISLVRSWLFQLAGLLGGLFLIYGALNTSNTQFPISISMPSAPSQQDTPAVPPMPSSSTAPSAALAQAPSTVETTTTESASVATNEAPAPASASAAAVPAAAPAPPGGTLAAGDLDEEKALALEKGAGPEKPLKLRFAFAEVARTTLEALTGLVGLAPGSFAGDVVPGLSAKLEAQAPGIQTLDSEERTLALNQPIKIFKGAHDTATDTEYGVNLTVTPTQVDDKGIHILVKAQTVLKENATAPDPNTETPLQDQFILPVGSGVFISGMLPHKALNEEEKRLYGKNNVLRIMATRTFETGASEFVIFIEVK